MRKDDLTDPYGLYEESYWDSVRAGRKNKEPENGGDEKRVDGEKAEFSPEETKPQVRKRRRRPKKRAGKKPTALETILSVKENENEPSEAREMREESPA